MCRAAAIEGVGLVEPTDVPGLEHPGVAHQPDHAARGEGSPAEAEEEELVPGLEVLHDEAVGVAHVARQPVAERTATDALRPLRAHAGVVEDPLLHPAVVLPGDRERHLRDVGRAGQPAARGLVRRVPGAVAADHQPLDHRSPSRQPLH
jgi:hypothetical protein